MQREKVRWSGHSLLGRKAFEMLPEWEKALVKPDMSKEALSKSYMPGGINYSWRQDGLYVLNP